MRESGDLNSYKIESDKLDLKIAIVNIASIHMHEETIPEAVQRLAEDLIRDKVLRHPIIVDEKTLVVLDGMHRAAALQMTGCVRIPVCLVDYDNPSIKVETWYRIFTKQNAGKLLNELPLSNVRVEEMDIKNARDRLENRSAAALIATNERCFIAKSVGDLRQDYRVVTDVERVARSLGYEIGYDTESDALNKLREKEAAAVLGPPPIRKKDVREFGVRDELFPHKATRHIIPARPLGIDVPIEFLRDRRMDLSEVNRQLIEKLRARRLLRLDPGSLIENRRYEEQVFLFK
jgi:hypothetical protein